jgi:hypothetical protein
MKAAVRRHVPVQWHAHAPPRLAPATVPDVPPRLLVAAGGAPHLAPWEKLPELLPDGALLVVNDAATFPGELPLPGGEALRLFRRESDGSWLAVHLGAGSARQRTEDRPLPGPPPTEVAGLAVHAAAVVGRVGGDLCTRATDSIRARARAAGPLVVADELCRRTLGC